MSIGTETNQQQTTRASPKAGVWETVKKAVFDYSAKTSTGSKNAKETLSIQKKQLLISKRKQEFGLEYLNLMEANASEEEMTACVTKAMEDVATLKQKISKYEARISTNRDYLERKLCSEEESSSTLPVATVTPSGENEEAIVTVSEVNCNRDTTLGAIPYITWANLNERAETQDEQDGSEASTVRTCASPGHIAGPYESPTQELSTRGDTAVVVAHPTPSAPVEPTK